MDSTLALARDGYEFILKRARRYQSDVFETRLMLQRHLCITGAEAAKVFYDENRFIRRNATPRRVKASLLGFGSVQGLDDEEHRARKRLLMSHLTHQEIQSLLDGVDSAWRERSARWGTGSRIVLYEEAKEVLAGAVCAWAGVPLAADELPARTRELAALFESAAALGPWHWRGRVARQRLQDWLIELIGSTRENDWAAGAEPRSALASIALHRSPGGKFLEPRIAAVELLNLLRPTVAVAVYVVFVAVALHDHPAWRERIAAGGDGEGDVVTAFVQEVRRYYPFFPFQAARVRTDFEWQGHEFKAGTKVLLDIYGTNHDARIWGDPQNFRPERFVGRPIDPFELIPQGGAEHYTQHRCAGEWLTIELMKAATLLLTRGLRYDVPDQDLTIAMNRMPAVPESGFILSPRR